MDEVRMDDLVQSDEWSDESAAAPEDAPERFLILRDVREAQPAERIGQDGVQDYPYLALFGNEKGLLVEFIPGVKTQGTDEEGRICLLREELKQAWPALTHHIYTGEWCNSPQVPGDKIHLQLDPFQRELLLQALKQLKSRERGLHGCANLYTDTVAAQKRAQATGRIQEIEVLELAIELASAPAEEPGDELS